MGKCKVFLSKKVNYKTWANHSYVWLHAKQLIEVSRLIQSHFPGGSYVTQCLLQGNRVPAHALHGYLIYVLQIIGGLDKNARCQVRQTLENVLEKNTFEQNATGDEYSTYPGLPRM